MNARLGRCRRQLRFARDVRCRGHRSDGQGAHRRSGDEGGFGGRQTRDARQDARLGHRGRDCELSGRRLAGGGHLAEHDQGRQQGPLAETIAGKLLLQRLLGSNEEHPGAELATTHRIGNFGIRHAIVASHDQHSLVACSQLLHGLGDDLLEFQADQGFEPSLSFPHGSATPFF